MSEKCSCVKLPAIPSASICIVIQGDGTVNNHTLKSPMEVRRGVIFFVAAEEEVVVEVKEGPVLLFQAYAGL